MSNWGNSDFSDLKKLKENIDNYLNSNKILEEVAKELTARLLGKVIPRTPVGQYPSSSGKVGGTLRRGWTSGKNVTAYVESLNIKKGNKYVEVDIINPVKYASFVENGHRTSNHKGWVPGRHMLRISVDELQSQSPSIIKNIIERELREVFK